MQTAIVKATIMKSMSEHARAAKLIRQHLKKLGIKGSVKAATASMTSSVRIVLDNANPEQVDLINGYAKQYQYGKFDGMRDIYEYTNNRDDIPQVRHVFVRAEYDDTIRQKALDAIASEFNLPAMTLLDQPANVIIYGEREDVHQLIYRTLRGSNYPHVPFWEKIDAAA